MCPPTPEKQSLALLEALVLHQTASNTPGSSNLSQSSYAFLHRQNLPASNDNNNNNATEPTWHELLG